MAVAVQLAKRLATRPHRYSYRFLFIPGTIGSITWLAFNQSRVGRIKYGLVLSCLGDPGAPSYKRSRRGDSTIDRAAAHALRKNAGSVSDFVPYGYDERQYCSPGFNLAVGRLSRSSNGKYAEYHTSADNTEFVRPECLLDSLVTCEAILAAAEGDRRYRNLNPYCEPQLGRRGLYEGVAGKSELPNFELALLWVLNQSDGCHGLLEIAEKSGIDFQVIETAARALQERGLLMPVEVE
jgi:aminopeptidase-like protein